MKHIFVLLAVVIGFGASGRVFGLDAMAYESIEEPMVLNIEHFDVATD